VEWRNVPLKPILEFRMRMKTKLTCCNSTLWRERFTSNTFLLHPLFVFALAILFPFSCFSQTYHVDDVVIVGNRRIDSSAVKQQIKKTHGSFSQDEISEGVAELYKTGFFDQVSASIERGERDLLYYTVVEKPAVRKVFIKGNEAIKESELSDVFSFGTRRFLDKGRIDSLVRQAQTLYQSRGYYDSKVTHSIVPVEENQVDVTFTVNEGERYRLKKIVFRGLNEVDPDELRAVIETKRYKWWNSWLLGTGRLNKDAIENDKALLRQYFLDHGYVEATISDPVIEKSDEWLVLAFEVKEGEQFKIGKISASGDLVNKSASETLQGTKIAPGEVFSATKIREDSFTISEKFSDVGYAFVNVVPNTSLDRASRTVDLSYDISKGKKVSVDKIIIKGNQKTYDNVIRREMRISEQETFSSSKVKRSEVLLKRLGYFDEANITTEPTDKDDKVNLGVNVKEASTGTFTIGAGYSSSDGALFNARISENNIFGTGRKVDLLAELGDERNNLILSLLDPRFQDSYLSFGGDIQATDRTYEDFDRQTAGGGLTFGYPLEEMFGEAFEDISTSLRYELLNVEIGDVSEEAAQFVKNSEGSSTSSSFTPQITRNTIDNPLNPTKGSRQIFSVELAGAGGDEKFYLVQGRNVWYQPLFDPGFGPFVFSLRTRVGYGDTFDNEPFPLFQRFFPGGINSVRGYDNRTLGPKDANGREYGGSKEFVNNTEIIFPLVNAAGLRGVVFYDVGEAFDDDQNIKFGDLRHAYGAGIRWSSPLGPIRIELGFPVDKEKGEDSPVTSFSFGAPF
jgi:outer membrane protein insertion porin family